MSEDTGDDEWYVYTVGGEPPSVEWREPANEPTIWDYAMRLWRGR